MNRIFCLVGLLVACGGTPPKARPEPLPADPAWAHDYEEHANAGCECADADCLAKVHGELAAMETAHGGMDEAPPGVHKAHGKFDQCWRDGTRDITRDFEHAAQSICTCTTAECLRVAKIELNGLVEGKYRENLQTDLAANPGATAATIRIADCVSKVTMPASAMLALLERTTDAMCGCRDFACAQATMKDRAAGMQGFLDVDASIDMNQVSSLSQKYCDCMEKVATAEVKGMSPVPALTSVSVDIKCQ